MNTSIDSNFSFLYEDPLQQHNELLLADAFQAYARPLILEVYRDFNPSNVDYKSLENFDTCVCRFIYKHIKPYSYLKYSNYAKSVDNDTLSEGELTEGGHVSENPGVLVITRKYTYDDFESERDVDVHIPAYISSLSGLVLQVERVRDELRMLSDLADGIILLDNLFTIGEKEYVSRFTNRYVDVVYDIFSLLYKLFSHSFSLSNVYLASNKDVGDARPCLYTLSVKRDLFVKPYGRQYYFKQPLVVPIANEWAFRLLLRVAFGDVVTSEDRIRVMKALGPRGFRTLRRSTSSYVQTFLIRSQLSIGDILTLAFKGGQCPCGGQVLTLIDDMYSSKSSYKLTHEPCRFISFLTGHSSTVCEGNIVHCLLDKVYLFDSEIEYFQRLSNERPSTPSSDDERDLI